MKVPRFRADALTRPCIYASLDVFGRAHPVTAFKIPRLSPSAPKRRPREGEPPHLLEPFLGLLVQRPGEPLASLRLGVPRLAKRCCLAGGVFITYNQIAGSLVSPVQGPWPTVLGRGYSLPLDRLRPPSFAGRRRDDGWNIVVSSRLPFSFGGERDATDCRPSSAQSVRDRQSDPQRRGSGFGSLAPCYFSKGPPLWLGHPQGPVMTVKQNPVCPCGVRASSLVEPCGVSHS